MNTSIIDKTLVIEFDNEQIIDIWNTSLKTTSISL